MHQSSSGILLCLRVLFSCAIFSSRSTTILPVKSSPNVTSSFLTESTVPDFCTSSIAWTGDAGLDPNLLRDCRTASNTFWNAEVSRHGMSEFEFLNNETASAHRNINQRTPRRYTYGTCTIALITKPDIPDPYWPGIPLSPLPVTDTASYDEIYMSLLAVVAECLHDHSQVGWALAGWFASFS